MKRLAGLLIACFIFFSVGCGGGSDKKTETNQNENIESSLIAEEDTTPSEPAPTEFTPISDAEFEKLTQVGTWRISSSVRKIEGTTTATNPPSNMILSLRTIEAVTSNESAYQFCDGYGVKPNDPAENVSAEADICGDGSNIAYYKKDDTHFKASITCKNGNAAEMEVNKISNEFGLNLGSLKFLPQTYPAIDTNKNICANVTFYDVKPDLDQAALNALPYYPGREVVGIEIVTPYAGNFLQMNISFPWKNKETLKPGIYHVDETNYVFPNKTSANVVMIGAFQIGQPPYSVAMNINTKSGTVNLEYFDEFEARGTYEFTAFGGEKITGAFNYSLK